MCHMDLSVGVRSHFPDLSQEEDKHFFSPPTQLGNREAPGEAAEGLQQCSDRNCRGSKP